MTTTSEPIDSDFLAITRYEVGPDDRIRSVSGDWSAFARGNAAPEMASEAVVGRSLLEFIGGAEIRHLVQLLLERVRSADAELTIPFRCDAPGMRRWMELHLEPAASRDGGVLFESRTIREEQRDPVALLDPSIPRSDQLLRVCAWCRRVEVDDEWREIEFAARELDLFGQAHLPQITHAICPSCQEGISEAIGDAIEPSP